MLETLNGFLANLPTIPTLDFLQSYLVVMNAVSLFLHLLDFAVLRPRDHAISPVLLGLVTAAGGALGTVLTHLIWDLPTVKDNAWQHVLALTSLILWGVTLGFVYVCPFNADTFMANLQALQVYARNAGIFLAAASLLTFVVFAIDKYLATKEGWRIPEAVLLLLSLLGGTLGGLLGMLLLRHKVHSAQFAWGLPLIFVAQLALAAYLVNAGLIPV